MTDEEIIGHILQGDTLVFAEFVRRHQDAVYAMALRFTALPSDARDMSQEAFLKVFRGLAGFKGEAKISTWLFRIVYNLRIDWLRRRERSRARTVASKRIGKIPMTASTSRKISSLPRRKRGFGKR
jgi:RNA polymerase sigma factor (sigma-70 family)